MFVSLNLRLDSRLPSSHWTFPAYYAILLFPFEDILCVNRFVHSEAICRDLPTQNMKIQASNSHQKLLFSSSACFPDIMFHFFFLRKALQHMPPLSLTPGSTDFSSFLSPNVLEEVDSFLIRITRWACVVDAVGSGLEESVNQIFASLLTCSF